MNLVKAFCCVMACVVLASCSSVTSLSTHRDATIYLHGSNRAVGTGSAVYQDSKPVWASTTFRVEAPGCDPTLFTIYRSDDIQFGRVLGGFLVLIPWLWAGDYEKSYGIALKCDSNYQDRTQGAYR